MGDDPGVEADFDHSQINPMPELAGMLLRAHENRFGRNPVHAVLFAESETLEAVPEKENLVEELNRIDPRPTRSKSRSRRLPLWLNCSLSHGT